MKFAVIAGEASGDALGAELISALRSRYPHAQFVGVTGPQMRSVGCESLADIEQLSVMGLAEVLPRLPGILRLRRTLIRRLLALSPVAVIGVDAPDFNLPLENRLRRSGIKTVHVVSPSVWAWRSGRIKTIAESANLMLCLFPFELQFYLRQRLPDTFTAKYIGHPLADVLAPCDKKLTRATMGLPQSAPVVAILPGSRIGEVRRMAKPFAAAARQLAERFECIHFLVPLAKPELRPVFEEAVNDHYEGANWHLVDNTSHKAISAADVVLLASGTATLECLLLDRPMVVGYRVAPATAWIVQVLGLIQTKSFSLPNLLCKKPVVPEFIQRRMTPEQLCGALWTLLHESEARQRQTSAFAPVRTSLRQNAASRAATEISELLAMN